KARAASLKEEIERARSSLDPQADCDALQEALASIAVARAEKQSLVADLEATTAAVAEEAERRLKEEQSRRDDGRRRLAEGSEATATAGEAVAAARARLEAAQAALEAKREGDVQARLNALRGELKRLGCDECEAVDVGEQSILAEREALE